LGKYAGERKPAATKRSKAAARAAKAEKNNVSRRARRRAAGAGERRPAVAMIRPSAVRRGNSSEGVSPSERGVLMNSSWWPRNKRSKEERSSRKSQ